MTFDPELQFTTPHPTPIPFSYPHEGQATDELAILELYAASGQGEGYFAGVPSIFVRANYCPVGCHFCFVGETRISIPKIQGEGTPSIYSKEIRSLQVGDLVYAFDEKSGQITIRPITNVTVQTISAIDLWRIEYRTEESNVWDSLVCTRDHPFFVDGKWIKASEITTDMTLHLFYREKNIQLPTVKVISSKPVWQRVLSSLSEYNKKTKMIEVYNLTVEGASTYFANRILVHNCDTKYSWRNSNVRLLSPEKVFREIEELGSHFKHVVYTGGEPLAQPLPAVHRLMTLLTNANYWTTIETSGIVNPFLIDSVRNWKDLKILYSVSPKLSSSKSLFKSPDLGLWLSTVRPDKNRRVQFKLVVSPDDNSYEDARNWLINSLASVPKWMKEQLWVILQPETHASTNIDEMRSQILSDQLRLQEMVMKDRYWHSFLPEVMVAVRPQQHALLYGSKRLV